MAALVPIPWQPHLFLTPSTLARLELASRYLGRNIIVRGPDGAWRPYAVQKKYYDLFKAGKGNPASNPDTGQRGHLRGASFDAIGVDSATQAACRKAGLTRDAVEAWHWNDPDLYKMPVIMSNFATAGGTWTPLGDDMSAAEIADLKKHVVDTVVSAIAQIQGVSGYENPNSITAARDTIRNDIGYQTKLQAAQHDQVKAAVTASTTAVLAALEALPAGPGGTTNLAPIIALIEAIPEATANKLATRLVS